MDKIWDRNPSKSEVIGRCGGDEKKRNDHAEPTKSERLKKILKKKEKRPLNIKKTRHLDQSTIKTTHNWSKTDHFNVIGLKTDSLLRLHFVEFNGCHMT